MIVVAPSLNLFQTCAMLHTRNVVIPAAMETLSVQGAGASIASGVKLNRLFKKEKLINTIGIVPVMINARLQLTQTILTALTRISHNE